MEHLERIRAAINRRPVDRVPYALWRHFPDEDRDPLRLAEATLQYQKRYRSDFIKLTFTGGYAVAPGLVFKMLGIYTKMPGKPPDLTSPFALRRGATVVDFARTIHRDFPDHLRQARVWGSARFEGQAVPRDHVLSDKDIVELNVDLA